MKTNMTLNMTLLQCKHCNYIGKNNHFIHDVFEKGYRCPSCNGINIRKEKFSNTIFKPYIEKDVEKKLSVKRNYAFSKQISLFRYTPQKYTLINELYTIMDKQRPTFVEPFCKKGSIGLALLEKDAVQNIIINTTDRGEYALYQLCINDPMELINAINDFEPKRENYFYYRRVIERGYDDVDNVTAAMASLIVSRLAKSGIGKVDSKSNLLNYWNPKELEKNILLIQTMADRITVLNQEPMAVIDQYYWDSNATLFVTQPSNEKAKEEIKFVLDTLLSSHLGEADVIVAEKIVDEKQILLVPNRYLPKAI